jgi:hypothetical protein
MSASRWSTRGNRIPALGFTRRTSSGRASSRSMRTHASTRARVRDSCAGTERTESISARNHSTEALPARANGDTSPGRALAASRRVRRATVGRSATKSIQPISAASSRSAGLPTLGKGGRPVAEDLVQDRGVQLLLVAEVVEDRGAPDADVGDDVVAPRGLEAALGEVALRGGHDLGAGLEAVLAAAEGRGGSGSAGHRRLTTILARQ